MLAGYLMVGVGVAGGLAILDGHTYPKHALHPFFVVANVVIWPITVLALVRAFLEMNE